MKNKRQPTGDPPNAGCLTRIALGAFIVVWSVIETLGQIGKNRSVASRQRSVTLSQRFARFRTGLLVHYVRGDGSHALAVVTQIGADAELGEATLCVLGGAPGGWFATAFFDPDTKARGAWHWIEGSLARAQSASGNPYREL